MEQQFKTVDGTRQFIAIAIVLKGQESDKDGKEDDQDVEGEH